MQKYHLSSSINYRLSNHARQSIEKAEAIARDNKIPGVSISCLLLAVSQQKGSIGKSALENLNLNPVSLKKILKSPKIKFCLKLDRIITSAFKTAGEFSYPYVGTEHIVFACLTHENPETKFILSVTRSDKNQIVEKLKMLLGSSQDLSSILRVFNLSENLLDLPKLEKKEKISLNNFSQNLNDSYSSRERGIVGREKEIHRIINILNRRNKNNPLLIGEPGIGKTAIVEELARKINSCQVPPSLIGKKIYNLDLGLMVAGTSYRGEFEARIKSVIKECSDDPNVILFIDEIHTLVGTGSAAGSMDAANILKPALTRGEIRLIGATTLDEYKKHLENDRALERRFQPVLIKEPTPDECYKMLTNAKQSYEQFHGLKITSAAVKTAVELSVRYLPHRYLPDKAIDLIDEASAWKKSKQDQLRKTVLDKIRLEEKKDITVAQKKDMVVKENYEKAVKLKELEKQIEAELKKIKELEVSFFNTHPRPSITEKDIVQVLSLQTGIPVSQLQISGGQKIKKLIPLLSRKIIGQKKAIENLASVLLRSYSGLADRNRPLGSFLFLGPTGVGKTYTAKVLAEEIFPTQDALIRIDMSEFMEKHNVSRLVGAPAGYVGYGEGGTLTEKIRHNPHSVILFDEVEKAHPDFLNILLQIMEDGTLTDAAGKSVNFQNTIIILTSNCGSGDFVSEKTLGFSNSSDNQTNFDQAKTKALEAIKNEFRPELLNRLDNVIVFNPLNRENLGEIAKLELERLKKRLAENKIKISFDGKAIDFIARRSSSLSQGARLIRKNIQRYVEDKLARVILEKDNKIKRFIITADAKNIRINYL